MNEQLLTLPCELIDVHRNRRGITIVKAESQEEIPPELTAKMMDNVGKYGWLCFLAGERKLDALDVVDLPDLAYDKEEKTHSQRLRAVLYVAWQQEEAKRKSDNVTETAENYYRRKMEAIIDHLKSKLDPV